MSGHRKDGYPDRVFFEVNGSWESEIIMAIQKAPKKKGVGSDELFAEAFQIEPALTARLFTELWKTTGRVSYLPRPWYEALLFPRFRKDDPGRPRNYRPVPFYHARARY